MGLPGNDDFSVKVSADGATWQTAPALSRTTARVGFGVTDPQAVLHAKAAMNGQNLLIYDDAVGDNLWRIRFDSSALHHYLSRQTVFNLPDGLGMDVIGSALTA